ncbi:MAG: AAA family ATPase [Elusimicrobia bacterium]|nr:AAA family ATPase [Elusimicrobiota bacterium]
MQTGLIDMPKELTMSNSRSAATRILSILIVFAVCRPSPVMAAVSARGAVPGKASASPAVAASLRPVTFGLGDPGQAALKASEFAAVPGLSAAPAPLVLPQAVAAHPVIDLINRLQSSGVSLPETLGAADAAKIEAAAQALPEGSARDNLLSLARIAAASAGQSSAGKIYDNASNSGGAGAATIFGGGARARAGQGVRRRQAADPKNYEVAVESLRWVPAPEQLPASTRDVAPGERKIIGQAAALRALRFGLRMPGDDYNVFVSGPDGTGRSTAVRAVLEEVAPSMPVPPDLVALTNPEEPDQPVVMRLPAGTGKAFSEAVGAFSRGLAEELPKLLSSEEFGRLGSEMAAEQEKKAAGRQREFDAEVAAVKLGKFGMTLRLQPGENGSGNVMIAVTFAGQPIDDSAVEAEVKEGKYAGKFTSEEYQQAKADLNERMPELMAKLEKMMAEKQKDMAAAQERMEGNAEKAAAALIALRGQGLAAAIKGPARDEAAQEQVKLRIKERSEALQAEIAKARIGKFGLAVGLVMRKGVPGVSISANLAYDGQVLNQESAEKLVAEGKFTEAELEAAMPMLEAAAAPFVEKLKALAQANRAELEALRKAEAKTLAPEQNQALEYVERLLEHAKENYQAFLPRPADAKGPHPLSQPKPEKVYQASLLVDNSETKGAPVVWEQNPSFENLFGSADPNIMPIVVPGAGIVSSKGPGGPTLKAGSYLRANGGFLIMDAMAVLRQPGAWPVLMQAIRSGQAEIYEGGLRGLSALTENKQAVPARVKVVLIGSPMIKMLLRANDEAFAAAFNASADFEASAAIDASSVAGFVEFLKSAVVNSAGAMPDLARDAISAVMEAAARMADSNRKLSTVFGAIHQLLREAAFWATGKEIGRADFDAALAARREREEPYVKAVMDRYLEGSPRVETSGSETGQINGLAVMGTFGVPMRLTVVVGAGKAGVISVDRQAKSTGSHFDKALGIVEGFLKHVFAQKRPISADISLAFEQAYGGIDGDSATSTEIYAILSSLSGVPIKQSFAVTGSADQFGNVQPIGGANEKIEGFFALTRARGLTGEQGVIIPRANVADLQLSPEVVAAVRAGKFRIYAVDHVSQGLEILTGKPYSEIVRKAAARLDKFGAPPAAKRANGSGTKARPR